MKKCFLCNRKLKEGKNFCSYKCYGIYQRKRERKVCEYCKKVFISHTCYSKIVRFCSRSCYEKGRKKGKIINCIICKKKFYVMPSMVKGRKYCSQKCMKIGMMGKNHPQWASKKVRCEICKKKFYGRITNIKRGWNRFCSSKCRTTFFSGKNCNWWQDGKGNKPYPFEFGRTLREFIRERDNRICQLCGKKKGIGKHTYKNRRLSVHHIDYNKKNCKLKNLITLCQGCNSKVNYNRIYWKRYFKTKQEDRKIFRGIKPNKKKNNR